MGNCGQFEAAFRTRYSDAGGRTQRDACPLGQAEAAQELREAVAPYEPDDGRQRRARQRLHAPRRPAIDERHENEEAGPPTARLEDRVARLDGLGGVQHCRRSPGMGVRPRHELRRRGLERRAADRRPHRVRTHRFRCARQRGSTGCRPTR